MSIANHPLMTIALHAEGGSAQGIRRAADDLAAQAGGPRAAGAGFAHYINEMLHSVSDQDRAAGQQMADVDTGRSDDLVGAMIASQEASLSFSMLLQVRNKVMAAVDDLVKLPV